jgi:hypothetical protein
VAVRRWQDIDELDAGGGGRCRHEATDRDACDPGKNFGGHRAPQADLAGNAIKRRAGTLMPLLGRLVGAAARVEERPGMTITATPWPALLKFPRTHHAVYRICAKRCIQATDAGETKLFCSRNPMAIIA